jgi:hypothetical protein
MSMPHLAKGNLTETSQIRKNPRVRLRLTATALNPGRNPQPCGSRLRLPRMRWFAYVRLMGPARELPWRHVGESASFAREV